MTGKIGFWLAVFALVSCTNQASTVSTSYNEAEVGTIGLPVYFEKTACFGRCPAFVFEWDANTVVSLTITRPFRDGALVDLEVGSYRATLSTKEAKRWNAEITEAEGLASFSTLDPIYDNPMVTDLPSTILEINGHRVVNRYRGPDLNELYTLLEQLIATSGWQIQE